MYGVLPLAATHPAPKVWPLGVAPVTCVKAGCDFALGHKIKHQEMR